MLPLTALRSMCVMIATPCYGNAAQVNFLQSVAALTAECIKAGLAVRFDTLADSLITSARNTLVAKFLSDPVPTHLFFLDADVGFEPIAFIRLLLADRDVAAGVYPKKEYNWPPEGLPKGLTREEFEARYSTFVFGALPSGSVEVDRDGFAEVAEVPAGFLCIKRQVFDRLKAGYPQLEYATDAPSEGELPGTRWLFFDTMHAPEEKRYFGEDWAFCRRWRGIGGKIHMDVNSKLTHQGPHTWRGDLRAHLAARHRPS